MSMFKRAKRIAKTALSGTSAVLDIAYELSGRRVEVLHQGAAFLYDVSRTSQPEPFRPATQSAPPETIEPEPAPAESAEAENAPESVQGETTTDEATEETPAESAEETPTESAETDAAESSDTPASEGAEAAAEPAAADAETSGEEEAAADTDEDVAFPIEDYDSLNVRQVQAALEDLSQAELELVRDYERKNKRRKTIFRAINKLSDQA